MPLSHSAGNRLSENFLGHSQPSKPLRRACSAPGRPLPPPRGLTDSTLPSLQPLPNRGLPAASHTAGGELPPPAPEKAHFLQAQSNTPFRSAQPPPWQHTRTPVKYAEALLCTTQPGTWHVAGKALPEPLLLPYATHPPTKKHRKQALPSRDSHLAWHVVPVHCFG